MRHFSILVYSLLAGFLLTGCSLQKQLNTAMVKHADPALDKALFGFSLYDESTGKIVYEHYGDHVFTPASNTKLLTFFASMQHLPDSIPGFFVYETSDTLYLKPNGDPTFLHPDFKNQPLFEHLKKTNKPIVLFMEENPRFQRMGQSWSWSEYQATYMPERAQMPIYGNIARFKVQNNQIKAIPGYFAADIVDKRNGSGKGTRITRQESDNVFVARSARSSSLARPFTQRVEPDITAYLLRDTLAYFGKELLISHNNTVSDQQWKPFYTQSKDSVLKIMMHRSDNFFAEQMLLMCGQALTGHLSDRGAIQAIKKEDLSDLGTAPSWVDGSGLSRGNRMSPDFFIKLLKKIKDTQDWSRLQNILPQGNDGTLSGLYKGYEDHIWGKTGTLSGDIALSGYLITEKGHHYIFSFLVNHHQSSANEARKAVEKVLTDIIREH